MEWDFILLLIALCVVGCFYTIHSLKSLRTGVFKAWYNGTFKDYFVYRERSPVNFYWHVVSWCLIGLCMIGLAAYLLNKHYPLLP
ncbi:DUF2542 family protein [Brenneria corticis]|uniref:DUF2542 domain-containing protein n=1 Tax=Brenneria corticis TaxID=2173106 RepID=A0A2U1U6D9_9GAMM|nr:hypothetical protein DDT56_06795 [Brenneria sp. CFCC 11842]